MMMLVSTGPATSTNPHHKPHTFNISCTTCRQRKVKCTRIYPCLPCKQSGFECVFLRRRSPRKEGGDRRRQGIDVAALTARLDSVEALVKRIQIETHPQPISQWGGQNRATANEIASNGDSYPNQQPDEGESDYIAKTRNRNENEICVVSEMDNHGGIHEICPFWRSLTDEIGGMKDLLIVEPSDDELDLAQPPDQQPGNVTSGFLFGTRACLVGADSIETSAEQVEYLTTIFIANVDPLIKIFHVPSLRKLMRSISSDPSGISRSRGEDAIVFAVYFAAVTSMTDEECFAVFRDFRHNTLTKYRFSLETALDKADFTKCADFAALQAFVLFLICLRSTDESRTTWMLVSLAIRIGQMLRLHHEIANTKYSPFEAEMRRRLWLQIIILDARASADWGSDPMILDQAYSTNPPANINDDDMDAHISTKLESRENFTGMTFSLLCQEASILLRMFYVLPKGPELPGLQDRKRIVIDYQKRLNKQYLCYCDLSAPIGKAAYTLGQLFIYKAWLVIHYPMKERGQALLDPSVNRRHLLLTAITILELSYQLETDLALQQWWWMFKTNVQWHALAVSMKEISVQANSPLTRRAWDIIDKVYEAWSQRVADTKSGFLWRPIRKLYKKSRDAWIAGSSLSHEETLTSFGLSHNGHLIGDEPTLGHGLPFEQERDASQIIDFGIAPAQNGYFPDLSEAAFDMGEWGSNNLLNPANTMLTIDWTNWDEFVRDTQGANGLDNVRCY